MLQSLPERHGTENATSRSTVTFVRTPILVPKWMSFSGFLCPPIGLAYLAAAVREAGYPVFIVDPIGESPFEVNEIPGRPSVLYGLSLEKTVQAVPAASRYIGVSCIFSQEWPVSKDLVRAIRRKFPEAIIIAGGEHITAAPEQSLEECPEIDYAVLGEGEVTLNELLRALDNGRDLSEVAGLCYVRNGVALRTHPRARVRDLDSMPGPAWDLIPIETYVRYSLTYGVGEERTMPLLATRGCPFECTFCSNPTMWTTRWYARSPKLLADEMEHYVQRYGATNFDFHDLTAIIRKDWIREFCRELMHRRLDITWQLPSGTRSEALDEEVMELLAKSGHRNLVYAPENGSEQVLKAVKKKVNLQRMLQSIRSAVRHGISVKLNMVLGFPTETRRDMMRSYGFLARAAWIGVDDIGVAIFIPYPGSQLFRELRQSGQIPRLDDDYYYSLISMSDARNIRSYSPHLTNRELIAYKFLSYAWFYSLNYLFRPQRLMQMAWHLYRGKHRTRMEKGLKTFFDRIRLWRGQQLSRFAK
jgi:anaerobic magnesium-protoporphyrin IX monomethyl ester cyclase